MRSNAVRRLAPLSVLCLALIAAPALPAQAALGDISEFSLTSGVSPEGIATGPDGNLWFTERWADAIGQMAPDGTLLHEFQLQIGSGPFGIAAGPDDAMWFTERGADRIGRIAMDGSVTEYDVPGGPNGLVSIAKGPDGNLWFTELSANQIGRIDTGGSVTEYDVPTAASKPFGIAAGPDGDMWFTEQATSKVGLISPSGAFVDERSLPPGGQMPQGIAAGHGSMWIAGRGGNALVQMDPTTFGSIEWWIPTSTSGLYAVSNGTDDAVWFAERAASKIGRLSVSTGIMTEYIVPSLGQPDAITQGPDGDMWFTTEMASTVGKAQADRAKDTTAPTIRIDSPFDGSAYMLNDPVTASYTCTDELGGSGIASCTGTVPDGAPLDTSKPGVYQFKVVAVDNAGNKATATSLYVVFLSWGGKLELPPTMNSVTAGSAVPVWFSLGNVVSTRAFSGSPTTTQIDCTTLQPIGDTKPAAVIPVGPRAGVPRVMYVWKTSASWAGTCRTFTIGVRAPVSALVSFT